MRASGSCNLQKAAVIERKVALACEQHLADLQSSLDDLLAALGAGPR